MVTYDPNSCVFYRSTKSKLMEYHVQYFGIKPIRGWVNVKSCMPYRDAAERGCDGKGLSKRVKEQYEVAMREVGEASTLSYKQRKLKFIFSFGPPCKAGKKTKMNSSMEDSSVICPMETESQNSESNVCLPEDGKKKELKFASSSTKKKSKRLSGSGPSLALASRQSLPTEQLQRSSTRAKKGAGVRPSSVHCIPDGMAREGDKITSPPAQSGQDIALFNGSEEVTEVASSPACLHDQHTAAKSCAGDRSSSDYNFWECDQCMDYLCGSDSQQLKCTAEPEKAKQLDMEVSSKQIYTYMQTQYGSDAEGAAKSFAMLPGMTSLPPSHTPPTRGLLAKDLAADSSGSAQEEESDGASSGGRPCSSRRTYYLPAASLRGFCSSAGSLSSENGSETGKSGPDVSTPGRRRGKRRDARYLSSYSVVPPSSLLQVQPMKLKDPGSDKEPGATRRATHGRESSSNVFCSEGITDKEVDPAVEEDGGLPDAKRKCRGSRRYSEQCTLSAALISRRSSKMKRSSTSDVPNSSAESAGAAAFSPPGSSSIKLDGIVSSSDAVLSSSAAVSSSRVKKRMKQNPQQENGVCSICECEDTNMLVCKGLCSNLFHLDCLGMVEKPNFDFVCDECLIFSETCFVCGIAHGEVKQCSKAKCSKVYHLDCIKDNKLFQFGNTQSFICPLHVCAKCTGIGTLSSCSVQPGSLLQCLKCPLALHQPDCLIGGCEVVDNSHMVCYQHVKIIKDNRYYKHTNLNTCFECGSTGSLYCCDVCSAAYHLECLEAGSRPGDSSSWKCPSCAVHDLPTYGSLVITKYGVWR